ncbi:PAC2 family-domain-containing protein [Endogone sp. FLAS-F59071]|nr:PAC2 family-domain-containing protein [Endogone sp. FLAS-F59071]|eukprot:RUS16137.1 PAC2 family-domain-containing protein [Endogone sp. FLAS-F59071]
MDVFVPLPNFNPAALANSTLILPSVSIGNVPQLTTDLLTNTLGLVRVGFLHDRFVIPVAGAREETQGAGVTVAIEVFQSADRKWTVIQQRAPLNTKKLFVANLLAFIKAHSFSQVILLSSADASSRIDVQITGQPFRILAHPPNHPLIAHAQSLGLSLLEIQPPSESDVYLRRLEEQEGTRQARNDDDEEVPQIPGGGVTRALFIALKRAAVPVVAVLVFALEGVSGWRPPKSWEGLFGTPYQTELYQ